MLRSAQAKRRRVSRSFLVVWRIDIFVLALFGLAAWSLLLNS